MSSYHTVIIGAGPAGYTAALKIADSGKSVCLIDEYKKELGGTCLNRGCIPAKSILESGNLYKKIKSANFFGLKASIEEPNLEAILEKANKNISLLKKGLLSLLRSKKINLKFGRAAFLSQQKIVIKNKDQTKEIEAENFILATGSKPKRLPGFEIDNELIFNSDGLFKKLPKSKNLLIIGGGYIGCELAQFYNSLGSQVTIIDIASSLLPGQNPEIAKILEREFSKKRIKILTSQKATPADLKKFETTLIAVGREPNLDNLNLGKIGVRLEKGFVKVDDYYRTTVDNIYAVGDLINTPMLAHVAYQEAEAVADFITKGAKKKIDYNLVPEVIFTEPQIASFGLRENQVNLKNLRIETTKKLFRTNPKAHILGQIAGFSKLVFDKKDKRLLGASIIGPEATELIHILVAFAKRAAAKSEIETAIYAHPTLSEIFAP